MTTEPESTLLRDLGLSALIGGTAAGGTHYLTGLHEVATDKTGFTYNRGYKGNIPLSLTVGALAAAITAMWAAAERDRRRIERRMRNNQRLGEPELLPPPRIEEDL